MMHILRNYGVEGSGLSVIHLVCRLSSACGEECSSPDVLAYFFPCNISLNDAPCFRGKHVFKKLNGDIWRP